MCGQAVTRVNVGISVAELCDQHLIAEYKELPRCYGVRVKRSAPKLFKLGAGHVAWCAQYQHSLWNRHRELVAEMMHRGFKPESITLDQPDLGKRLELGWRSWTEHQATLARPLLQERIVQRLATMKREPKWTKRTRPDWAKL